MLNPPAIIFVNNDISQSVYDTLVRQLFINKVLDGYSFDQLIITDPIYPEKIKQLNQRIMVTRSFADRYIVSTWDIPDIVIFIKNGLASVLINKYGPPGLTLQVVKLYWGALGVYGPFNTNLVKNNSTASKGQFITKTITNGHVINPDLIDQTNGILTAEKHKTLRQLIHLADGGPMEGFKSGLFRETLPINSVFPTNIIWWESSAKLKKIVEKDITWTNNLPTVISWKAYSENGSVIIATVTDIVTYNGIFEISRTRNIS